MGSKCLFLFKNVVLSKLKFLQQDFVPYCWYSPHFLIYQTCIDTQQNQFLTKSTNHEFYDMIFLKINHIHNKFDYFNVYLVYNYPLLKYCSPNFTHAIDDIKNVANRNYALHLKDHYLHWQQVKNFLGTFSVE